MTKTGIIGHRGAAGLALENSVDSIRAALGYNIDALEFDVRLTRDGHLVVLHDAHTGRIAPTKVFVNDMTLAELRRLQLHNGQNIPTLEEVLQLIGNKKPVVIDIKDAGSSAELLRILAAHPEVSAGFTSLIDSELVAVHGNIIVQGSAQSLQPSLQSQPQLARAICVRDKWNPFRILQTAKKLQAEAISLNMRLINPITYKLARKRSLEVRIYTINAPWLVRFFRKVYPEIIIYTNHPERFV